MGVYQKKYAIIINLYKRPLGLKAPLSNNTLSMIHISMKTK